MPKPSSGALEESISELSWRLALALWTATFGALWRAALERYDEGMLLLNEFVSVAGPQQYARLLCLASGQLFLCVGAWFMLKELSFRCKTPSDVWAGQSVGLDGDEDSDGGEEQD